MVSALRDILANTLRTHPDIADLDDAIQLMQHEIDEMNERSQVRSHVLLVSPR